jgi:serine phosphatase RsbU (regulator of sigma subunit)
MQQAGCEAVYLGVESLHDEVLRFLRKTGNPQHYLSKLTEQVVPSLLDSIDVELLAHTAGAEPFDDITLLALRRS